MSEHDSFESHAMKLFAEALLQPKENREIWLNEKCNGDSKLQRRVRSLLLVDDSGSNALRTGAAHEDIFDDPPPERAGAYRLGRLIGRGGMGAVYEGVRDTGDFELKAAIKIIRPGILSESLVERFERERQILATLNHPNIANLLDGGTLDDGSPFIIMEYVEGEGIVDWADEMDLSFERRLDVFRQVCDAVQHAHQNLIIHRDITPSNILITKDGQAKLIDFGIAKPQADDEFYQIDNGSSGNSLASMSSVSYTHLTLPTKA